MKNPDARTNWNILPYLIVLNVPCQVSKKYGPTIHAEVLEKIEFMAARYVVGNCIQIRGRELKFLRKVTGTPRSEISKRIGCTEQTIINWELESEKAISIASQAALRILFADKLGVQFNHQISALEANGIPSVPVQLIPTENDFKKSV